MQSKKCLVSVVLLQGAKQRGLKEIVYLIITFSIPTRKYNFFLRSYSLLFNNSLKCFLNKYIWAYSHNVLSHTHVTIEP